MLFPLLCITRLVCESASVCACEHVVGTLGQKIYIQFTSAGRASHAHISQCVLFCELCLSHYTT